MPPVTADAKLAAYATEVDARLDVLLPTAEAHPPELHRAMRYSALAPGKRLRPALCLASAAAVGVASPAALDAACAVEMVHCFSLIHDDLPAIDNDELRRGRPTCHVAFGEAMAILAGDALFALAFQTLAEMEASEAQRARCLACLARASGSGGLVGGEVVDVLSEGRPVDGDTLRQIHLGKTGALMGAACEIGAILGGGDESTTRRLAEYGRQLGLAFQIADDVLNEVSSPEALGKASGSDRERAKATYPALYGLDIAREMAREAAQSARAHLVEIPRPEFLVAMTDFAIERAW